MRKQRITIARLAALWLMSAAINTMCAMKAAERHTLPIFRHYDNISYLLNSDEYYFRLALTIY